MRTNDPTPLTPEELAGEGVTALPDKEVVSILDLAADIDLAIDGAAPIDLAVALNANIVAPIDAAVGTNVLSDDSVAEALADQGVQITQTVDADATATGIQDSTIDQSDTVVGGAPLDSADDAAETAMVADGAGEAAGSPVVEPVDGSVVVDSTGAILGVLDAATGNVIAADGTIVGTLNDATGLVVDSAGNLIGSVTNIIDGAVVADDNGDVLGVLDALTGNVLDASGNIVGVLDPLTGEVLDTVGTVLGTVTSLVDGMTVVDSLGNVVGTLDAATGNVVNAVGNVVGALNPLTGQVLDAAGNIIGTVGDIVDDLTDTLAGLDTGDLLKGDLLNVDVNVDLDADLAAPINGAIAANANVAAPIDAAVSANILSDGSQATAIAQQDAIITQTITGSADALSDQTSSIDQSSIEPVDTDTASTDGTDATDAPTDTSADAVADTGDSGAADDAAVVMDDSPDSLR